MVLMGCSTQPVDFPPGERACEHCKMSIVDLKFHTQAISKRGKIYPFDSIECMILWNAEHPDIETEMWFKNYLDPGVWMKMENAKIIRSHLIHSPMGSNLLAISIQESESSIPEGAEVDKVKLLSYIKSLKISQ